MSANCEEKNLVAGPSYNTMTENNHQDMVIETVTAQLVHLLLLISGDVELNPGPAGGTPVGPETPSLLMDGLAALIAAAPEHLKQ